jgi:hypothetical protein
MAAKDFNTRRNRRADSTFALRPDSVAANGLANIERSNTNASTATNPAGYKSVRDPRVHSGARAIFEAANPTSATGPAGTMGDAGTGFSFADSQYGLGEANARRRYAQSELGSQLRLSQLGPQTQRQLLDVSRQYRQAAPQQITGFTGRGLGRSGLFREAMQQFAGAQQRDLADIAQSQAAQQAQIELERQNAAIALQDELDRLELQRQQQILADAAALTEFAPIAGLV